MIYKIEFLNIVENTGGDVKAIAPKDDAVCGVQLANKTLDADYVLVGVGALPMDSLAQDVGLATDNGIVVDTYLATEDPDIYAIGDCVAFPQVQLARQARLESVQNATDQARALALTLTGQASSYSALPCFWSDIGTLKLQISGLSDNPDQLIETHTSDGVLKSIYHLRDGNLIACETINSAGEHMLSRRMIAEGFTPSLGLLATGDLKEIKEAYQNAKA